MWAYFELFRLYTNVWVEPINFGTLVVKGLTEIFVDKFLASTVQIPSFVYSGTMVIELREFNDKKKKKKKNTMDTMLKLNFVIIWPRSGSLMIFGTQITFDMFCAVKSLKVKARSEFPNVWGEYKNHSNPYIQGTTVPCDRCLHFRSLANC